MQKLNLVQLQHMQHRERKGQEERLARGISVLRKGSRRENSERQTCTSLLKWVRVTSVRPMRVSRNLAHSLNLVPLMAAEPAALPGPALLLSEASLASSRYLFRSFSTTPFNFSKYISAWPCSQFKLG